MHFILLRQFSFNFRKKLTMKKKSSLTFLSFLFLVYTSAQVFVADLPPGCNKVISAEKEKGLDGSPWLTESWVNGITLLKNGDTIKGLKYRLNVYRNLLYFQFNNDDYVISSPDSIAKMLMDGKTFIYSHSMSQNSGKKHFMEVAVEGKSTLLIHYYPVISPANYNVALGFGSPNETVTVKESYLIKIGDSITIIDKKGKLIPVALNNKKQEILAFMKREKISAKKRSDIERVILYYNSL